MALTTRYLTWLLSALTALVLLLASGDAAYAYSRDRVFRNLSVEFIGSANLPQPTLENGRVENFSAITYDRQRDRFYALAVSQSETAPPDLITFKIAFHSDEQSFKPTVQLEQVTPLKAAQPQSNLKRLLKPQAIALGPENTVFISGQAIDLDRKPPFVCEFDLDTGSQRSCLDLPNRYLPTAQEPEAVDAQDADSPISFTALTLVPGGIGNAGIDPFPLFAATEFPLPQDRDASSSDAIPKNRWLQYLFNSGDRPFLIAEYAYPLDPLPANALEDILALGQSGHFLSLEQAIDNNHSHSRLYQVAVSGAMDTSRLNSLKGLSKLKPLRKKLLLDLDTLDALPDNLTGMTLGPALSDGSQSLILLSGDRLLVLHLVTVSI
jgi:hypothetical protein